MHFFSNTIDPFQNNEVVGICCYISYIVAIKVAITGSNTIERLVRQLLVVDLLVGHGCFTDPKTIERSLIVASSCHLDDPRSFIELLQPIQTQ